jgi:hypothetical protein
MLKVKDESEVISMFLEWLDAKNICLATNTLISRIYPYEHLLAEYFEIDLKKVKKECLKVLQFCRELQKEKTCLKILS